MIFLALNDLQKGQKKRGHSGFLNRVECPDCFLRASPPRLGRSAVPFVLPGTCRTTASLTAGAARTTTELSEVDYRTSRLHPRKPGSCRACFGIVFRRAAMPGYRQTVAGRNEAGGWRCTAGVDAPGYSRRMLGLAEADYSRPGLGDAGLRDSQDLALEIRPALLVPWDADRRGC